MRPPSSDDRNPFGGAQDRSWYALLGRQLRGIYQIVADEPVPQRFVDLIERLAVLERHEENESSGTGEGEGGATADVPKNGKDNESGKDKETQR
jgi:hypothetical protein